MFGCDSKQALQDRVCTLSPLEEGPTHFTTSGRIVTFTDAEPPKEEDLEAMLYVAVRVQPGQAVLDILTAAPLCLATGLVKVRSCENMLECLRVQMNAKKIVSAPSRVPSVDAERATPYSMGAKRRRSRG
jgi:hypothetical protein